MAIMTFTQNPGSGEHTPRHARPARPAGPGAAGLDDAGPDSAGPDSAGPDSAGPNGVGPDSAGSDGAGPDGAGPDGSSAAANLGAAFRPLVIDVAIPLGVYFVLRDGFGASLWLSLALGSVLPAIRAVLSIARDRKANLLAVLMLLVNLAGIVVSFLTGDPRLLIAKNAVISSVIGFAILGSVAIRRPLMTAGLRPFVTRGAADRAAAWDRLAAGSARFRRLELWYSATWGSALLADCVARLWGALTLPVATMAWLGTVFVLGTVVLGAFVSGVTTARPITEMVDAEVS